MSTIYSHKLTWAATEVPAFYNKLAIYKAITRRSYMTYQRSQVASWELNIGSVALIYVSMFSL